MDEKRKVTQEELDNACILHNKYIEGEDVAVNRLFLRTAPLRGYHSIISSSTVRYSGTVILNSVTSQIRECASLNFIMTGSIAVTAICLPQKKPHSEM